jgi:hypothetical protein
MKHKRNKFLIALKSLLYSSVQLLVGLVLHPYRSMQLLVRKKVLLPFAFYPTLIALILYLLLQINFIYSIYQSFFLIKIFYQVVLFFCFYWQLALFYLWIRFSRVFNRFEK